jgi:thiosulfate dehydrogenase [quinone] large subunit
LPWTEATIGLLLLLGLFTRFALVAGSLEMIVLMAGITLAQNWEVAGIQLIYCAISSSAPNGSPALPIQYLPY